MWKENRKRFTENSATDLQQVIIAAYILTADEKAFQSDHLRLLYVDNKLNIISKSCVHVGGVTITDVYMDWYQDAVAPEFWEQGIGEDYRVGGELGAPL